MKIVSIIVGIILVIGGIFCIASPAATFLSIGLAIGFLLLISGINQITSFFPRSSGSSVWELIGGILTVVVAALLIISVPAEIIADVVLIYIFAAWILISGIMRIFTAAKFKPPYWGFGVAVGILSAILGVYSFFHPIITAFALGILIGLWVIIYGFSIIMLGIALPGKKEGQSL